MTSPKITKNSVVPKSKKKLLDCAEKIRFTGTRAETGSTGAAAADGAADLSADAPPRVRGGVGAELLGR